MREYVELGPAEELGNGEVRGYQAQGTDVAVARVDGELLAFVDVCTHRHCTLSPGEVDGDTIECECHGSVFSMRTGEVVNPPATEPISTYPVREHEGRIEVDLSGEGS